MAQINIRISEEADQILTLLASQRKVAKTVIAREFMLAGLSEKLLPMRLELFQAGKINLKQIISLSQLPPGEALQKIADAGIEPPISEAVDDYTWAIREQLSNAVREGKGKFKGPPPPHPQEETTLPEESED